MENVRAGYVVIAITTPCNYPEFFKSGLLAVARFTHSATSKEVCCICMALIVPCTAVPLEGLRTSTKRHWSSVSKSISKINQQQWCPCLLRTAFPSPLGDQKFLQVRLQRKIRQIQDIQLWLWTRYNDTASKLMYYILAPIYPNSNVSYIKIFAKLCQKYFIIKCKKLKLSLVGNEKEKMENSKIWKTSNVHKLSCPWRLFKSIAILQDCKIENEWNKFIFCVFKKI